MKAQCSASSPIACLPRIASGVVAAIAALVLMGWLMDMDFLKRVMPSSVAMNPLTAVSFILAGIALWISQQETDKTPSRNRILTAKICSMAVVFIGLTRLLQYALGWD